MGNPKKAVSMVATETLPLFRERPYVQLVQGDVFDDSGACRVVD